MVTGASRGIGRGIALQLSEAGATVYITGRQEKTLKQTAAEVWKLATACTIDFFYLSLFMILLSLFFYFNDDRWQSEVASVSQWFVTHLKRRTSRSCSNVLSASKMAGLTSW